MSGPLCERKDCFSWHGGECGCLENNRFKNEKPCPFHKTKVQVLTERMICFNRLVRIGSEKEENRERFVTNGI